MAAAPIDTTKQCPSCNVTDGFIHMADCTTQVGRYNPVVHRAENSAPAPAVCIGTAFTTPGLMDEFVANCARYPDDNPKTIHGFAKPSISLVPPVAIIEMARAFRHGADKYGPANWRDKPVTIQTYLDAALRHLLSMTDGEDVDPESGCLHAAHVASCMAIIMDAAASGTLQDRRPTPGKAGELIRQYTAKAA